MRHLMSPLDFTTEELDKLFDLANDIEKNKEKYAHICEGKILADLGFGCPPAVAPIVCGERLDETALATLAYYGIEHCRVIE